DALALDAATSITGTAGEVLSVARTLTNATAENGVLMNFTAADTTVATTSQFGLYLDNLASTEGLDSSLVIDNSDGDDAVVAAFKLIDAGGGFTSVIDNAGTLISGGELNALDNGIESADIVVDTIVAVDIAVGGVATSEILDGTIADVDMNGALTGASLAADTLVAGDIATGAVATAEILDATIADVDTNGALTGAALAADTLVAGDIATGAVATAEILDGTIADADTNGALTGASLAADTLVAGDIATGAVETTEILDGTIAAADIASGAVTAVKLQAAGADLGGADVTVNFSNTNAGAFNTNITTDGTFASGTITVTGNVLPEAAGTRDLGSATVEWATLFMDDDTGIEFGLDQDVKIVYDETTDDRLEIANGAGAGTQADLWIEDRLSLGLQVQTLSDDGIANDALTPTASYVHIR
ncbi:MAG: hypothetical protein AAB658_00725, partial [Chloroflexota bacterium]